MMSDFKMPSLGADMESGTLVAWLVNAGDKVVRGDVIAEVETDKGNIEIEVWQSGTLLETLVEPGVEVPVGKTLATISTDEEEIKDKEEARSDGSVIQADSILDTESKLPVLERPKLERLDKEAPSPHKQHFRISPLARKIARQYKVDLSLISGSGPHNAITRSDVQDFVDKRNHRSLLADRASDNRLKKQDAMRMAIASTMSKSKRDIPHYYLKTEINMANALEQIDLLNKDRSLSSRILPAALYLKAIASACAFVPEMNGHWIEGVFHPSKVVHVGVAISLRQGGLVAPAIQHVEEKSIDEIMKHLLDLVDRARTGKLRSSEVSGATITLTNLGDQGVETVFGVIYPPQVSLVGFGRILKKPWAERDMLGLLPVVTATLSADHRVSDGHRGGLFLNHINKFLSNPGMFNGSN